MTSTHLVSHVFQDHEVLVYTSPEPPVGPVEGDQGRDPQIVDTSLVLADRRASNRDLWQG